MTIPAQKFREIVFQLLYSRDIAQTSDEAMIELLTKELAVTKKAVCEAQERVQQILDNKEKIDSMIAKTSLAYTFERIQSVERNVLRIGVFELLFDDTIPPKVAISEALRLAKKFSTKEAALFVNAILDAIYQSSLGKAVDKTELNESSEKLDELEKFIKEVPLNTEEKSDTGFSD
ncbi:MAG: transcription antitermination factor NusB [Parachlamydiaceae bacterium]